MALSLKDPETDRLAREVARLTGENLTAAVRNALAEKLARERLKRGQAADRSKQIEAIISRVRALPVLDDRSADDILGYNDRGHFD